MTCWIAGELLPEAGDWKTVPHSPAFKYPMWGQPEPSLQDRLVSTPRHSLLSRHIPRRQHGRLLPHLSTLPAQNNTHPEIKICPHAWEDCFLGQAMTILSFFITLMPMAALNAAWAPLWLNETDGAKWRSSSLLPVVQERMGWWTTCWSHFCWTVKVPFNWWQLYEKIIGSVNDRLAGNGRFW